MPDKFGWHYPPGVTGREPEIVGHDDAPDEPTVQETLNAEPIECIGLGDGEGSMRYFHHMRPEDFDELEPAAVHAWMCQMWGRSGPFTWRRVEALDKKAKTCIEITRGVTDER